MLNKLAVRCSAYDTFDYVEIEPIYLPILPSPPYVFPLGKGTLKKMEWSRRLLSLFGIGPKVGDIVLFRSDVFADFRPAENRIAIRYNLLLGSI